MAFSQLDCRIHLSAGVIPCSAGVLTFDNLSLALVAPAIHFVLMTIC
jgi:hypothetical protein